MACNKQEEMTANLEFDSQIISEYIRIKTKENSKENISERIWQ